MEITGRVLESSAFLGETSAFARRRACVDFVVIPCISFQCHPSSESASNMFSQNFQWSEDALVFRSEQKSLPVLCLSTEEDGEANSWQIREDQIEPAQWLTWARNVGSECEQRTFPE